MQKYTQVEMYIWRERERQKTDAQLSEKEL